MKEHEKYAEEIRQKFEGITKNWHPGGQKWVVDELAKTLAAIFSIQGQIEAIMSLELPKSDYAVKVEYLQKSIEYLKKKL